MSWVFGLVASVASLCLSLLLVSTPVAGQPLERTGSGTRLGAGFQGGDWLQNWLSGPLPGQPMTTTPTTTTTPKRSDGGVKSQTRRHIVRWPVPPKQRSLPKRTVFSRSDGRTPSLADPSAGEVFKLPDMYLQIGVVATSGKTDWNHDASKPGSTLGNPSSELTYDDVATLALELSGRVDLAGTYFVRGNVGVGMSFFGDGNLRDDDFRSNQVLFSSTDSAIPNTDLFYVTLDAGKEILHTADDRLSVSVFAGYQFWREQYEAYGVVDRLGGTTTISDSINVIRDAVEWQSLRLGVLTTYQPSERLRWTADLAVVPYTVMHNEDSHLLRTATSSLGPAPNVIMDGSGYGFQGEIGMVYYLTRNWASVFNVRYWHLVSDGEIVLGPKATSSSIFPLNDLDSMRYGLNAGLRYIF